MSNESLPEEKAKSIAQQNTFYSPSAIANIFNNALNNNATRAIVQVRGIYTKGRGANYNGFYYDQLKEETSDACITLIVPAIIRPLLIENQVIEGNAYITKKVQTNGARIELQLNLMEVLSQRASLYTDEQMQAIKIIQRKVQSGYRDVDAFLKAKIVRQEPISMIIIVGTTAIIDSDIKHQLEETIGFYDIEFLRVNLASEPAIINAMQTYHGEADLLIIARGGGENLGIFNRPAIAEAALDLAAHFITAIGHEVDKTLLQQVADRGFITPTALGQYLNSLYNETMAELQNSKARLVEDITKQLQVGYEQQINVLKEQQSNLTLAHQKRLEELQSLSDEKLRMAKRGGSDKSIYLILILIAIVIGVFIGKGCN